MRIWIDADACPGPVREILFRAAERCRVDTTLVANRVVRVPESRHIHALRVGSRFDAADEKIVESVETGDLVVTADVPLAAQVVEAGAVALNPRGTLYTRDNIDEHLARRDYLEEARAGGNTRTGPPALSKGNVQEFANQLDRYLARNASGRRPAPTRLRRDES